MAIIAGTLRQSISRCFLLISKELVRVVKKAVRYLVEKKDYISNDNQFVGVFAVLFPFGKITNWKEYNNLSRI
ncbi:hypothetical protein ACH3XW_43755 [Acanthocheilonema viteae]